LYYRVRIWRAVTIATPIVFMPSLASSPTTASDHSLGLAIFPTQPDLELLLACGALSAQQNSFSELQRLGAIREWQQLFHLAEYHGVIPLLYQTLRRFPERIPAETLEDLQQRYEHNARRNLKFTAELIRILDCLEGNGIAAIPYKGPVLAEAVYGDLTLREFSDLDILVRPADVPRVKVALKDLGYSPNSPFTPAEERAYLKSGYEFVFDGPAGRNLLEIQFAIVPRFYAVDFDLEGFFERALPASVGGRAVKALSPEDLLLALCVHAAKHAWIRLCWLRDIAGVVQSLPLNWDLVNQRATQLGIDRVLGTSLLLASRWLKAPMPDSVLDRWSNDYEIASLCDEITQQIPLSEQHSTESLNYFRLMLRLRERTTDKLRFAFRLLFTPSVGEWSVVRLPEPLFPLYRVVRFFRLSRRLLSHPAAE
jgi:Uncharacterised nucleotidyltransferase